VGDPLGASQSSSLWKTHSRPVKLVVRSLMSFAYAAAGGMRSGAPQAGQEPAPGETGAPHFKQFMGLSPQANYYSHAHALITDFSERYSMPISWTRRAKGWPSGPAASPANSRPRTASICRDIGQSQRHQPFQRVWALAPQRCQELDTQGTHHASEAYSTAYGCVGVQQFGCLALEIRQLSNVGREPAVCICTSNMATVSGNISLKSMAPPLSAAIKIRRRRALTQACVTSS